jgi:hypothetical protein
MEAQHNSSFFENQQQQLDDHQRDILVLQESTEQQNREKDEKNISPKSWILIPKEIQEIKETADALMVNTILYHVSTITISY